MCFPCDIDTLTIIIHTGETLWKYISRGERAVLCFRLQTLVRRGGLIALLPGESYFSHPARGVSNRSVTEGTGNA